MTGQLRTQVSSSLEILPKTGEKEALKTVSCPDAVLVCGQTQSNENLDSNIEIRNATQQETTVEDEDQS